MAKGKPYTPPINTPIDLIKIDLSKPANNQPRRLHNRWHPDIAAVATATTGKLYRMEAIDFSGGQVQNNDNADDIATLDRKACHHLSGPIRIEDEEELPAQPGDLLVIDIADLGPLPDHDWGFTGIFPPDNGGGFLTEYFPRPAKAIWDFRGHTATSRHIPGVSFPGAIHPGVIGTAPSHELLRLWTERETELVASAEKDCTLHKHLKQRPVADLPDSTAALCGIVNGLDPPFFRIAPDAARTTAGRENGGNCDIKNLGVGSRLYLPVFVEGANFSFGDMHFSQGDGAIAFCGAIEMCGYMVFKADIIRNGVEKYLKPIGPSPLNVFPIFELCSLEQTFTEWLVFEGQSIDEFGKQHFLDASISYKRCVLQAVDYLSRFGYTKQQVYLLLSCCPCEGRISGIVDVPNCCTTLAIPTSIFDVDIRPSHEGPPVGPRLISRGDLAATS